VGDSMAVADHMGSSQTQNVRDPLDVGRESPHQALSAQGNSETDRHPATEPEAPDGRSRGRRQSELSALEFELGNTLPEPTDGSTTVTEGGAGDSVLIDIERLRAAYCDHFIKTGELDQPMLAELQAYATSQRGGAQPDRRFKKAEAITPKGPKVIMPSKRPQGRPMGSKIMVIDGVRRLVTPERWERMKRETLAPENKTDTSTCRFGHPGCKRRSHSYPPGAGPHEAAQRGVDGGGQEARSDGSGESCDRSRDEAVRPSEI
jgi:hypothetical protein